MPAFPGAKKTIFLADMESFYASVEIARNPRLRGRPVAVCGDPEKRRGIILAASKEAKRYGVKTGMLAWQGRQLCPDLALVRPHMQTYIDYSVWITRILERFTDRIFPYSIDEQFLDLTGCEKLWGSPEQAAQTIMDQIQRETGVRCRIGAGENMLQAKMACDCFAKKNPAGFFALNYQNYARHTWPLPVMDLFGVGPRMARHFYNMAIRTIGQLASFPREKLKRRWGINGEILWLNAHGIDYSTIQPEKPGHQKGVGHSMTLPRDYAKEQEIKVVLLELVEEVCHRARLLGKAGRTVGVYCRSADFESPSGFFRQRTLPEPTAVSMEVYPFVLQLFFRHWDRRPVRAVGMVLGQLTERHVYQLSFFNRQEEKNSLSDSMDWIRLRFGPTGLFRAASLTPGTQLFERSGKIGGHEA